MSAIADFPVLDKILSLVDPTETERMARVMRLMEQATELFNGDANAAARWLQTPRPVLNDETPFNLTRTDNGTRRVETLIGQLKYGVYV